MHGQRSRLIALVTLVAATVGTTGVWAKPVSSGSENVPNNARAGSMVTTGEFTKKAGAGGLAEVRLSEIAVQKSENAAVKNFAQMMIDDHRKANEELAALAGNKKLTMPTKLDSDHQAALHRLQRKSGPAFDRAYAQQMLADHAKAITLFTKASSTSSDEQIREFATKTLPTLQHHKEEAEALNKQVGMPGKQSRH